MTISPVDYGSTPITGIDDIRAGLGEIPHKAIDLSAGSFAGAAPVDLNNAGIAGHSVYYRMKIPGTKLKLPGSVPFLQARRGVARRLRIANHALQSLGLEIYIWDAYRTFELQAYFYEKEARDDIRKRHPGWSEEEIITELTLYWNPPSKDPQKPSPHLTGGAVDVTLRRIDNGNFLNMGVKFDEASEVASPDYFEVGPQSRDPKFDEIRRYRRILYHGMTQAGFVNYPREIQHFSFGDRAWAVTKSRERRCEIPALYSIMNPSRSV